MRISDWSSDVCSSDLLLIGAGVEPPADFRVFALDVLAHHDEVDVGGPAPGQRRRHAFQQAHRAHVGVEIELATQRDQQAPERDMVGDAGRSEEHTSELQSLMRISYAVLCLNINTTKIKHIHT